MILTNLKNVDWWCLWSRGYNLLECGWWWCLSNRLADGWWHPVISWDALALFNRTEERSDGWKGGAYVAEVLKRAVVVESRLVVLGEVREVGELGEWAGAAHNPCAITWCDHPDNLVITCTADPTISSCFRTLIPHVCSTIWYDKVRVSCIFTLQFLYNLPII